MQIVQCYDDGVLDDIRLIEILRRYGATASFNLNFASHGETRSAPWNFRDVKEVVRLAKDELLETYGGFLVANHSLTHPNLENLDHEQVFHEVADNRTALEDHFGYEVTGFVYPFGTYNQMVQDIVRETGHIYARTTKNVEQSFPPADPTAFHPNCHFLAPDFWDRFATVKENNGVFYFWGHSYELITEDDWGGFEKKIAQIADEPTAQWMNLTDLFE